MPRASGPRALFIVLTDHPGGAERVAAALANRLAARGWDVEWRVLSSQASVSFSETNLRGQVRRRYGAGPPWRGLLALPFTLGSGGRDLVFTTHVYTNGLVSALRGLGVLRTRRLVTRESTTVFDRFHGLKRALFQMLYRLYGAQDLIVAQTKVMADHILPYVGSGARSLVRTLPNPVDVEEIDRRAAEPISSDLAALLDARHSVLVCGSLIAVKRPAVALEAFAKAREASGQDLQLVFMGEGPLKPDLKALAGTLGVSRRVHFLGQQANPYAIMRRCQYGLLTSSREGFPNVILEMMACGVKKIVMTPCAGDLDSLPGVTTTTDFSAEALAAALAEAVVAHEDRRTVYRAAASERSVDKYLDEILGLRVAGQETSSSAELGRTPGVGPEYV